MLKTNEKAGPSTGNDSEWKPADKPDTTHADPLPEMKNMDEEHPANKDKDGKSTDKPELMADDDKKKKKKDKSEKDESPKAPKVVIEEVNAPNTPASMGVKRIPPRKKTQVKVTVSDAPATFTVDNQSASNGKAKVNGRAKTVLDIGTHIINIKGKAQTSPGSAGNLKLVAKDDQSNIVASSNGFSVAAIPENWSCTLSSVLDDATDPTSRVGFVVSDQWESDSGVVTDLNKAEISEVIENAGTGLFAGAVHRNSGYLSAITFSSDTHSASPRSALTAVGTLSQKQACKFKDLRTGVTDIPMTNSGYKIDHSLTATATAGKFSYKIEKYGAAVTALGVTTDAGAGNISPTPFIVP